MIRLGHDLLKTKQKLTVGSKTYTYFSLDIAERNIGDLSRLPFSLKVLLENLLRCEDSKTLNIEDIHAIAKWVETRTSTREIAYRPARVLMQDFTGVPAVVDLAAMREALLALGGKPNQINPLTPVDLVIDHSVTVDSYANPNAFQKNVDMEFQRNRERYAFLRWGQNSLRNFRVVPPGTGICHQVNLEYLSQVVWTLEEEGEIYAYPDTLVGTDSHTTMVNGLAVLGWGVGGIEAEAVMLGQPISMVIPEVMGFKITGAMREGATATDLVLTVTEMLRQKGVVGKFVEFYGPGLDHLSLADRATISNMAPEYGATCGFFPIDQETINYLRFTGRNEERIKLVEAYAKVQGLWRNHKTPDPIFTETLELNLADIEPTLAGPKRPQDKVLISEAVKSYRDALKGEIVLKKPINIKLGEMSFELDHGSVVIAAITSCTNTSNPSVMVGAGLLARKALAKGLSSKPWIKTSLAPGSQVVTDYLEKAGLDKDLQALGFYLVGYGCTTCIGNSGSLLAPIAQAIDDHNLAVAGVLSGNRNFEGRIHSQVKLNYLASPLLVVAYALAGSMNIDLYKDPLGTGHDGQQVYLTDIWPTNQEIADTVSQNLTPEMFRARYADVFTGDEIWKNLSDTQSLTYAWIENSTYVKHPPFFTNMNESPEKLKSILGARPLAMLADSVTTDHISPAGSIKKDSPAGRYLMDLGVLPEDFNSYGSRRGNHEVMMRGTFANIRLMNEMTIGTQGGVTRHMPDGEMMSIYDAAMRYQAAGTPLVIIAGKEYGTGSSRDWAAKGTRLLGVKAVIAESFERIHRSNLIGMGVLPLVFKKGVCRLKLGLDGTETYDIFGFEENIIPAMDISCTINYADGRKETISLICRLDTLDEIEYYQHGGILHYVLRELAGSGKS
ncbi:MAG: aconitate hydratase AcnA [Alphaproteobacteria bacterium]|nr:aconitate hydratase AcnA [Alphaproteobacteria bacterium]